MRTAIVAALLALANPARAQGTHLALEAGTNFPIDVGVRGTLELGPRIQLASSLGFMPGGYVDAGNAFLVAVNAYSQIEANLIAAALHSSLAWQLRAGWRPWAGHGFYFQAGYGLFVLGGGLSPASVIAAGGKVQLGGVDPQDTFTVHCFAQAVEVELGWQWALPHKFQLRAALGGLHIFTASTSISHAGRNGPALTAFESAGAQYLDDTLTTYVYTPVLTFTVGYRLF